MKKVVLFIAIAFTLAVCLQVPARAESTSYDVGLRLNVMDADGTITSSYGTYTVSEDDVINASTNYNIVLSNSADTYNVSYLTFDLSGAHNNTGTVGRFEVTMFLDFVGDFVASDSVVGGELIYGLWIENYREHYDFDIDAVYFADDNSGGLSLDYDYLGFSSIGCKLFKATLSPSSSGSNVSLSTFHRIAVHWHWVGNPNSNEINFVLGNSSYVVCMNSDEAELDYMQMQNEIMDQKAQDVLNEISVEAPDFDDVSSGLSSDFDNISTEQSWLFEPPYGNRFYGFLVSCGTLSVSIALLGYILYGKKG